MKLLSYHRTISFLLTKRTLQSYEKLVGESYQIADSITGVNYWCDFYNKEEWGECTNAFQNDAEAEYMFKNLFNPDLNAIESEYSIQIDKTTIPTPELDKVRGYQVNTKDIIKKSLHKKLKKKYPHQEKGFPQKGTLILGIFDPAFGGFKEDLELNKDSLRTLKNDISQLCATSSFRKVILVDVLTAFQNDPDNRVYELFSST